MKKTIGATLLSLSVGLSAAASAETRTVDFQIVNQANAIYFTPLLVAAHPRSFHLFQSGDPASANLQAMAEGGDLSGLILDVQAAGGVYVENPAEDLLAPGATASGTLQVDGSTRFLSLVAMLLPTNDGFVGLDGLQIPTRAGVYNFEVNAYDAGTEANDELITGGAAPGVPGIPADPGGNAGTGGSGVAGPDYNPTVHIHRGLLGDFRSEGGPSDLDARVHRFMNPVAKVTLIVH